MGAFPVALLDDDHLRSILTERYTDWILCAACYGACPINGDAPEYLGPAALAKL